VVGPADINLDSILLSDDACFTDDGGRDKLTFGCRQEAGRGGGGGGTEHTSVAA